MDLYVAVGEGFAGWARGRLYEPEVGAREMRQALANYSGQGNKYLLPTFYGLLADLLAAAHSPDSALTLIEQGLAIANETGEHFSDPYLHRLRGDILLKGKPADPAPAEEAFQTAIAIAKEQGARSYELLASLSLAKLYQSTGRSVEAHAVLRPALEGFSPTPEMPKIADGGQGSLDLQPPRSLPRFRDQPPQGEGRYRRVDRAILQEKRPRAEVLHQD